MIINHIVHELDERANCFLVLSWSNAWQWLNHGADLQLQTRECNTYLGGSCPGHKWWGWRTTVNSWASQMVSVEGGRRNNTDSEDSYQHAKQEKVELWQRTERALHEKRRWGGEGERDVITTTVCILWNKTAGPDEGPHIQPSIITLSYLGRLSLFQSATVQCLHMAFTKRREQW